MTRTQRVALAFAAVASLSAAYSCRLPWWLGCVGIAAFHATSSAMAPKPAAVFGLAMGTSVSAIALHWLPFGLARSSRCPITVAIALAGAAAVIYGVRFAIAAWA